MMVLMYSAVLIFIMSGLPNAASHKCIISEPSPQHSVVFDGENVTYYCKVCPEMSVKWYTYNGLAWNAVQGRYQQTHPYVIGKLTLFASHETNNTHVICGVDAPAPIGYEESSNETKLIVQGLLEAPGEIDPRVTNDSITIDWTPPFSLTNNRTSYMVNVSMSAELITTSQTTERSHVFEFADHNINRCDDNVIEFKVWGINPVGEGNASTVSVTLPGDSRYCEPIPTRDSVVTDQLITPDPLFTSVYLYVIVLGSVILTLVVLGVVSMVCLFLIFKRFIKNQTKTSSPIEMGSNSVYGIACDKKYISATNLGAIPSELSKNQTEEMKMNSNPTYSIVCITSKDGAYTTNIANTMSEYEMLAPEYETIG